MPGRRAALLGALLLAACSGDQRAPGPGRGPVLREGRFGSLRDFVLVDRDGASAGAALFVDRFEATQADWLQFAASASGADVGAGAVIVKGRSSLPVGGMDLRQARAFARWRCGRLPSEEEWLRVTGGGGRSPFPWGSKEDATRANTGDLGNDIGGFPSPVQNVATFLRSNDGFNVYQGAKGQVADTITPGTAVRIKMGTDVNYVASHY